VKALAMTGAVLGHLVSVALTILGVVLIIMHFVQDEAGYEMLAWGIGSTLVGIILGIIMVMVTGWSVLQLFDDIDFPDFF
jgi:hypothetical protein